MNHVQAFEDYLEIEEQPQHSRGRDWPEVTAADLRGFLASIKPKPHRVHRLLASWMKFWGFLCDVQKVPGVGNPPGEIKRPKLPGRLPKYLETPDIARLLNAAHTDRNLDKALRNWAFIAFLYGTGARLSEVLGLTFDRIAYRDGEPVSIRVIGKGDKERTGPLLGTAQRALMQWLKVRKVDGHPTSPHVWSYLSRAQRGKPFSIRTMQAVTTAAAVRAGLDPAKVSPHKMRHSFATALVEQGRSLHEIGTILGHENPAATAIYGRVKAQQLAEAAASLPDVM